MANGCRRSGVGDDGTWYAAVDKSVIALTTPSTACGRRRWPAVFGERLRLHRERPKLACHYPFFLDAVRVSATLVRSVFVALVVNDHSVKHAGAIRSISSRNARDKLIKSVSSALSTSSDRRVSRGGRVDGVIEGLEAPLPVKL